LLYSVTEALSNHQHIPTLALENLLKTVDEHGFMQTDQRFLNILCRTIANFFDMLAVFVRSLFVGWRTNLLFFDWGVDCSIASAAIHGIQTDLNLHQTIYHRVVRRGPSESSDFFAMSLTKRGVFDEYPLIFISFTKNLDAISFPSPNSFLSNKLPSLASTGAFLFVDFRLQSFRENIRLPAHVLSYPVNLAIPDNLIQLLYIKTQQCLSQTGDEKNLLPVLKVLMDSVNDILPPNSVHVTSHPNLLSRYLAGVLAALFVSPDDDTTIHFLDPKNDQTPETVELAKSTAFLIGRGHQKICLNIIESPARPTPSFQMPLFIGEPINGLEIDMQRDTLVLNLFIGFEHHKEEFSSANVGDQTHDSVRKQMFAARQNTDALLNKLFTPIPIENVGDWRALVQNFVSTEQPSSLVTLANRFASVVKSYKSLVSIIYTPLLMQKIVICFTNI